MEKPRISFKRWICFKRQTALGKKKDILHEMSLFQKPTSLLLETSNILPKASLLPWLLIQEIGGINPDVMSIHLELLLRKEG